MKIRVQRFTKSGSKWKLSEEAFNQKSNDRVTQLSYWEDWRSFDKSIGARTSLKKDSEKLVYSTISPDRKEKVVYTVPLDKSYKWGD